MPQRPNEPEEWVESDDRAIRTGLRWSLVALIGLGVVGVGLRSGAQRAAVVREAWGDAIAGAAPVPVRDRLSGCCKS